MTVWGLARLLLVLVLRGRGGDEVVANWDDVEYELDELAVPPQRWERFVVLRLSVDDTQF
jgi:hypothetical protein